LIFSLIPLNVLVGSIGANGFGLNNRFNVVLARVISLVADTVIIRRRDAKRWKNDYLVKGVSLPPLAYNYWIGLVKVYLKT
jgi:hypothetical protein